MKMKKITSTFFCLLLLFGCAGSKKKNSTTPVLSQEEVMKAQVNNLYEEIIMLSGKAYCNDSSQCMTIGVGEKACGGPWSFQVYSLANSDTELLKKKVSEYNTLEKSLKQQQEAIISDCSVLLPPLLGCVKNQCVESK